MNAQDFKKLYEKRHTYRKFLSDLVPNEHVAYIVDAARLAPTGMNSQQWRFIAIRNKEVLDKMADKVDERLKSFYPQIDNKEDIRKIEGFKFFYTFFKNAPLVIAVIGWKTHTFFSQYVEKYNLDSNYGELVDPDILSLGGACENALLAATALGYASAWLTGPIRYQKDLEQILDIKPPEHLVSLLAIGKPDKERKGPKKKALDEILTYMD